MLNICVRTQMSPAGLNIDPSSIESSQSLAQRFYNGLVLLRNPVPSLPLSCFSL